LFLLKTFKVLNGFLCADSELRNYSLTHSLTACAFTSLIRFNHLYASFGAYRASRASASLR